MRCPACGQENPDGFKFCGNCGAPLADVEPPREVRKTVTVVFCDLTGSTALGDVTDPETLRATMRGYYDEMRTILERHGGTVEKFIGDAVMAVFGVPVAHEDDALRAVRAAWEMRAAVPALGLRARIGVNTGEVVAGEGDALVTGDAVNVAARLEQAAEPGEVLIGAADAAARARRRPGRAGPVEAKGKRATVDAFRLARRRSAGGCDRAPARHAARSAGASELEQLRQAFERTVREQRCHLFTRARRRRRREVAARRESSSAAVDAQVVTGPCLDYGEGITFWPVISILKQLGPRADPTHRADRRRRLDAERALLGRACAAARRLRLSSRSSSVFDDIQWGEPTFLDLVDHIADLSRGAPLLVLCLARPELLDKRPGWGGGKLNATTILLEPLSAAGVRRADRRARRRRGRTREQRILAAADGNPLFVEEMVALARERRRRPRPVDRAGAAAGAARPARRRASAP